MCECVCVWRSRRSLSSYEQTSLVLTVKVSQAHKIRADFPGQLSVY